VKYHAKLLNQAGLSYYGCCEALHHMFDVLKERITNLRALSISPWCDTRIAAEKLQDQSLLYWKPNPALTAGIDSNWPAVEELIRDTLQVTRGCHLAMVLKDTHTFGSDPNRPGDWVKVARRCIEEAAETAV